MAKGFVANGAIVHIVGRRKAKLDEAKTQLDALARNGGEVRMWVRKVIAAESSVQADVSSREDVARLVSSLTRLDVLINCAGIALPDAPHTHLTPLPELQAALQATTLDSWVSQYSVNVAATYHLSVSLLHLLAAAEAGGRIINISSIGSTMSDPAICRLPYQTSKAAIDHLTRVLASKLRETGVRVNAIAPGYFPSEMNDASNPASMVARAHELVPLKRAGEEEDIAGTAIWLASRAGSYVTGEVIPLAGGRNWGYTG